MVVDRSYHLRLGRYQFEISQSNGTVVEVSSEIPPADPPEASLWAPAQVLAFAIRKTFCLHASAVHGPRGALAFVGRSGKGKSTLAQYLSASEPHPWELVADDILPIDYSETPPLARCGSLAGFDAIQPERLPLAGIYVLRNWRRDLVRTEALTPSKAFVAVVRHSVATRLFDSRLKAAHFEACVAGSFRIPVRELWYPRNLAVLAEVRQALEADIALLPSPG
ncbi:MAG: hypothetical protein IT186_25755 [Acidobacteria bacterium]|nr:hypothetical protein [Acidobacteriota bacterium]